MPLDDLMGGSLFEMMSLVAGIVLPVAFVLASATVRRRTRRETHARRLMLALQAYADWVAAQRHEAVFVDDAQRPDAPLAVAESIANRQLMELHPELKELLVVHRKLVDFLWSQQLRRLKDPAGWLAAAHEAGYERLFGQHQRALARLLARCQSIAGDQEGSGTQVDRGVARQLAYPHRQFGN